MPPDIRVEVAYALPEKQYLIKVELPAGADIRQAIDASGIVELRPEIDVATAWTGIFSREAPLNQQLQEGDRVEIYRPIQADPKEIRRLRIEKASAKQAKAGV